MGCAPDVPLQRLQAFLGPLCGPRVDLEVVVEHLRTAEQLRRLRDGELDVGLVHDTAQATPGVDGAGVYRGEVLEAVVPHGHRVARRQKARLEDLAGEVLLVVPRDAEPGFHARVAALAESHGTVFRAIRGAPGPDVRDLLFAVASGHGVTLAPSSMLRVAGEVGEIVVACALGPPTWRMPDTCLVWPTFPRPERRDVLAVAREIARDLYRA